MAASLLPLILTTSVQTCADAMVGVESVSYKQIQENCKLKQ